MNPVYKKDIDATDLLDAVLSDASTLDQKTYQYYKGLRNRRIIINDEINETLLDKAIIPYIDFNDGSDKPIEIIVNTYGGDVFSIFALCDAIDNAKTPTTLITPAFAYSAGAYLMMAGYSNPFVVKKCYKHATGLIHAGSVSLSGTNTSVKDTQKFIEEYDKRVKDYVLTHSKITPEQYDMIERFEHFMLSDEMLTLGIVDEII